MSETDLWRGVIKRAYEDALGCDSAQIIQEEALQWFCDFSNAGSFATVCTLAEVDAESVRHYFLKKLLGVSHEQ